MVQNKSKRSFYVEKNMVNNNNNNKSNNNEIIFVRKNKRSTDLSRGSFQGSDDVGLGGEEDMARPSTLRQLHMNLPWATHILQTPKCTSLKPKHF